MARKFVMMNNGRVQEVIRINLGSKAECIAKFKTMFSTDHVKLFIDVPDTKDPQQGQVYDGTNFSDYVEPPDSQDQIDRRTQGRINKLESKAIWGLLKFVSTLPNCPAALTTLKDQIQDERNKL